MRNIFLSILLLSLIILTGCEKDAMKSLSGEWNHNSSYYKFTALSDFVYTDLHSRPWIGTVQVNGQQLQDCSNRYSCYPSRRFHINYEIGFDNNTIYYKGVFHETVFSLGVIDRGVFKRDISFVHEGVPVNIKIDLIAPVIEMKKGENYIIKDQKLSGDYFPVRTINFCSSEKISGEAHLGDILDKFDGNWSTSNGRVVLKYKTKYFQDSYVREFSYINNKSELLLYNPVNYSKYAVYGSIPEDKITDIYYYNSFVRPTERGSNLY